MIVKAIPKSQSHFGLSILGTLLGTIFLAHSTLLGRSNYQDYDSFKVHQETTLKILIHTLNSYLKYVLSTSFYSDLSLRSDRYSTVDCTYVTRRNNFVRNSLWIASLFVQSDQCLSDSKQNFSQATPSLSNILRTRRGIWYSHFFQVAMRYFLLVLSSNVPWFCRWSRGLCAGRYGRELRQPDRYLNFGLSVVSAFARGRCSQSAVQVLRAGHTPILAYWFSASMHYSRTWTRHTRVTSFGVTVLRNVPSSLHPWSPMNIYGVLKLSVYVEDKLRRVWRTHPGWNMIKGRVLKEDTRWVFLGGSNSFSTRKV